MRRGASWRTTQWRSSRWLNSRWLNSKKRPSGGEAGCQAASTPDDNCDDDDDGGLPPETRAFSRGHATQLPLLRASDLDWVVLAPPLVILDEGPGTGGDRLGGVRAIPGADAFAYADLALALVAEATVPTRSREMAAVAAPAAGQAHRRLDDSGPGAERSVLRR